MEHTRTTLSSTEGVLKNMGDEATTYRFTRSCWNCHTIKILHLEKGTPVIEDNSPCPNCGLTPQQIIDYLRKIDERPLWR